MASSTSEFKVGDKVTFGRTFGEKTAGTVIKVNPRKLKIRQDESRGTMKSHAVGTIWTVPPSLCEKANGSVAATPAPAAPAFAPYLPAPEFRVGDRVSFDARGRTITGFVRQVNRKTVSVQPGAGSRYWRVSPGLLRKADGPAPAPKAKRPEREILRDIDSVYCQLSPENLTCDGEASAAHILRMSVHLNRRLRDLFDELGRKVDEIECWRLLKA